MSEPAATHTGTEAQHSAGFPPFKTESFPSQIFWLVVTFAALFIVLWRIAGPRIAGVISARKGQIDADLKAAATFKADAEAALAAYETALATARSKAHAEAEANRKVIEAEVEAAKAEADADAKAQTAKAEAGIAAARAEAAVHVIQAAENAAVDIVSRLIGVTVPANEAAAAVKAVGA